MNRDKQISIAQNTQVKFHQFLYQFKESFTLPEFKAVRDITRGILASGSVIVNQIARELNEPTTHKKTAERCYRNLKHRNLHERLQTQIIQQQCSRFDRETLIIVDESDIVKNNATKMEGLNKVRDGSTGTFSNLGYDLLNIVAYRKQDNGYKMLPVSSDLYSDSLETDSLSNILHDRIDEITINSGNKGVFVFDRGFDSRVLIEHLVSNENSFIIRGVGKRNVIIDNQELPFNQVCQSIPLPYRHPGAKNDHWFECGVQRVGVRTHPHPKRHAPAVDVWLVKACHRSNSDKRRGYFYFLCDFPHQQMSEAEIIRKVMSYYRLRWLIEQAHRQVKQDYGWEAMQLLSYTGLKNLNSLLWLAICFLYAQKEYIIKWAEAYPRQFGQYRKRLKHLFEFVYSALMKAVKSAFSIWAKYGKHAQDSEPCQLRIKLI
jgi:hypothetical protein